MLRALSSGMIWNRAGRLGWSAGIALLFAVLSVELLPVALPRVNAQESFRVETDIFVGKQTEPLQYLTLFTDRIVYDFRVTKPEEITIYDWDRHRIVLIDPARKWKATLVTDEVLGFTAALKTHVSESNPVFYAATHPNFGEVAETEDGWFSLANKHITYRFKGAPPKNAESVARYREFADWSARLSAMRPGNLPPFARIETNKQLAERGWLPEEVERIIDPARIGQKKVEVRSRHLTNWLLSESDRKRMERVGDHLATFQEVSFQEFRDAAIVAQTEGKSRR
ncbi:MAG: hypothetical protein U1A77_12450 [Pirellulales bacterium]